MKIENIHELDQLIAAPSEQSYRSFFAARDKSYERAYTYGGFANPCIDDGFKESLNADLAFKIIPFASKVALEQIQVPSIEKALYLLRSLIMIAGTTELHLELKEDLAKIEAKLQKLSMKSPELADIKRHYRIA